MLIQRLYQTFGNLETAWMAPSAQLKVVEGFGPKLLAGINAARAQLDPQEQLLAYQRSNPNFLTPSHSHYPALLRQLPAPPPLLHYCGRIDAAEMRGEKAAIAIVGTRSPSEYGRRWTRRLTRALVKRQFTIVSGLAEGIDAEAHRACLAGSGRTIAVLGTGLDIVYPARNRQLYRDVLRQGLILSEYPAGTPPNRNHFPQRNRIVAGLCRAVIVVEAPKRSGALITANVANEFCRDVYVVPGTLDNPNARGCLELINQGAQVILDENNLLEMLGEMPLLDEAIASPAASERAKPKRRSSSQPQTLLPVDPPEAELPTQQPSLPSELRPLYEVLSLQPCSLDRIVQQTQLPTGIVSAGLLQLELLGLIHELPGKQFRRSR